jgi:hypothetical protein
MVKGIKRCKIYRCLDFAVYDDVLFWASCCLAYFGFLRSSEFTVPHGTSCSPSLHLSHHDVAFDRRVDPSCLQVFIKVSKTDPFPPFGKGALWVRVVLPCVRSNRYSATWRSGEVPTAFCSSVPPLTRTVFTERLRRLLSQAGITGHFGSHSFRIGAATTAGLAGVPEHMIQTLGRWSSSAYLTCIRTPRNLLARVTRVLC